LGTLEKDTNFVLQQANRIERILRQMRSLTAVSGNKAKHDLHTVVHDAVNIVADLFNKNFIKIEEKYSAVASEVLVDRDEMLQVLTNLFRNSLQAISEFKHDKNVGYMRLETSSDGSKIFLDIFDNGVGITKDDQKKLFETQFSTKAPDLGTGLGLSISRRFIRAFHGDLYLMDSDKGKGTCFRIELPLSAKEKKSEAAA
jgi:signal transduction histidine kinase